MRHVILMVLTTLSIATPAYADQFDSVRKAIREQILLPSTPSIAVAVAKNGKILWEEGFGWADREKRVPASEHTPYPIASISKSMTATGLMTLVQDGKIDLDKPINDYLGNPKLRGRAGDAAGATVRRVVSHTAGLPIHARSFYTSETALFTSMDETINRYGDIVTVPGERYEYSNLGPGLLGYIIERESGYKFAEYLRRRVFLPLGMTHTSLGVSSNLAPFTAARYGRDDLPVPFALTDTPGAADVVSSVHDLVRFGMFQLKDHLADQASILSDKTIDEMHRPMDLGAITDDTFRNGIGFRLEKQGKYAVISHGGDMDGVHANLEMFPDEDLVVVVLINGDNWQALLNVHDMINTIMLPGWKRTPDLQSAVENTAFVPSPSLIGIWRGTLSTYVKDVPVELIVRSDGEVRARFGTQLPALVDQPKFEKGRFAGQLISKIGTPDTDRYNGTSISLSLTLRGNVLDGTALALGDGVAVRMSDELSHWISLKKEP